jgi:hypothetical protein
MRAIYIGYRNKCNWLIYSLRIGVIPNIIREIKSRMITWVGHVGEHDSEDLGADGKTIPAWILGKLNGKMRTGCIWLRIGTSGGLL